MNFKRHEFLALTGLDVFRLKNFEKGSRNYMPQPEPWEPAEDGSVRRFTPLQALKTVLMLRLTDATDMNMGRAHGLIEMAGKELTALSPKIVAFSAESPVLVGFHFSRNQEHATEVGIFGGHDEHVSSMMRNAAREDIREGKSGSGPFIVLSVTDAYQQIIRNAKEAELEFQLYHPERYQNASR